MRSDLALAALASAAVPGMKPVAVAAIGPADDDSPEEHQQALVEDTTGRRWLVRAPLTPVAGARLQQHDELVRQLSRHVPFKVPAPVGYADVGRDGRAAVYPFVEGSPVDLRRVPAGPGLASALGRAVAAVHNVPRGAFEEQDVPVLDAGGCRQRLIAEVDRAAETGRVPTGLLARWEEAFDAAPLWQFATTPVHGRFRGSTVLVTFTDDDAASGRVVAVTGWEEAAVADPAVDLAELCAQASPQAWASVLESYTLARAQRPDPHLDVRARLQAEVRALRGLAAAVAADSGDVVRRAEEALRRMDRLTEDDDALVPATARGAATVEGRPAQEPRTPRTAETSGTEPAEGPPAEGLGQKASDDLQPGVDEGRAVVDPDLSVEGEGRPVVDAEGAIEGAGRPVGDEGGPVPGQGGGAADEEGPVTADVHEDDATMEVPVPTHLLADRSGRSATPVEESDADLVAVQGIAEPAEGADAPVAAGVGGPRNQPEQADVDERGEQGDAAHQGPDEEPDELDDEDRLTELYGMPAGHEEGGEGPPTTPRSELG